MSYRLFMSRLEGAGSLAACLLLVASAACGPDSESGSGERAMDVRFRGVGFEQVGVFSVGATGGPMAGVGGENLAWRGPGYMAWGIVGSDVMSIHGTQVPSDGRERYVRQWWNGLNCPASLEDALASNSVVLGIGGDPDASNATCTLFGVGPDETDPVRYEYMTGSAQSAAEIEAALGADEKARSFVLTAISRVGDDRYTFVAESVGEVEGKFEQFETVVRSAALGELEDLATTLASSGYIITASSWEGGDRYTLVGTRERGGAASRSIELVVSNAGHFTEDVARLMADGYAPVSVTMGQVGDNVVIHVIGQQ